MFHAPNQEGLWPKLITKKRRKKKGFSNITNPLPPYQLAHKLVFCVKCMLAHLYCISNICAFPTTTSQKYLL